MPPASAGSTRARPTTLLVLAAGLLIARVGAGVHEARHAAPSGGLVKWRAPDGAEAAAFDARKPILYDFSAAWCGPCKRMDREVFANEEAASLINSTFVAVHVDDDDQAMASAALRSRHRVDALPTLVVVRPGGEARRLQGYPGKQRVLSFLRHATEPEPPSTLPDFDR
jgi:thiol:disulfide interchange protein